MQHLCDTKARQFRYTAAKAQIKRYLCKSVYNPSYDKGADFGFRYV